MLKDDRSPAFCPSTFIMQPVERRNRKKPTGTLLSDIETKTVVETPSLEEWGLRVHILVI